MYNRFNTWLVLHAQYRFHIPNDVSSVLFYIWWDICEINVLPKRKGKVFHNPSHWRNIQAPVTVFSKRYACDTAHLDPFNDIYRFLRYQKQLQTCSGLSDLSLCFVILNSHYYYRQRVNFVQNTNVSITETVS